MTPKLPLQKRASVPIPSCAHDGAPRSLSPLSPQQGTMVQQRAGSEIIPVAPNSASSEEPTQRGGSPSSAFFASITAFSPLTGLDFSVPDIRLQDAAFDPASDSRAFLSDFFSCSGAPSPCLDIGSSSKPAATALGSAFKRPPDCGSPKEEDALTRFCM